MTLKPTLTNRKKALKDIWVFADLIGFHGGVANFSAVHKELAIFVSQPQHVEALKDVVAAQRRRLVLMPRGHLKSTICSALYVLWRIYRNPDIRILVATEKKPLAQSFIRELRQYLEDGTLQAEVWNNRPHVEGPLVPALDASGRRRRSATRNYEDDADTEATDKKIIWSSTAIQVIRPGKFKEATVYTTSTGTTVTGDHYDLLILDDIVGFRNSDTTEKREKLHQWADDLESVLNPQHKSCMGAVCEVLGDEVVILGTRYYKGDYYDYLEENEEELEYITFKRNIYANGLDDSEGFLWPEMYTAEIIKRLRKRTRTIRQFAAQYLNQIIVSEEQILKPDKVQYIHAAALTVKPNLVEYRPKNAVTPTLVRTMLVVDPAGSVSKTADYTAVAVGGVDTEGNLYVFDMKYGRWTPSQIVDAIYTLADKWQLNAVTVDSNGVGITLPYAIKEAFGRHRPLVIREWRHGGRAKNERIEFYLQPLWENDKVFFTNWLAQLQELQDEMTYFPNSPHDDCLDVMSMIAELSKPARKKSSTNTATRTVNTKWGGVR